MVAVLGSLFLFILPILYLKFFIDGICRYQMNKNAYKKRIEKANFLEKLFFIRFTAEIPRFFLVFYYIIFALNIAAIVVVHLLYFLDSPIFLTVMTYFGGVNIAWSIILRLFFWKSDGYDAYERWITKKRGQNNKK